MGHIKIPSLTRTTEEEYLATNAYNIVSMFEIDVVSLLDKYKAPIAVEKSPHVLLPTLDTMDTMEAPNSSALNPILEWKDILHKEVALLPRSLNIQSE